MGYSSWGRKESDTTERLNTFTFCSLSLSAPTQNPTADPYLAPYSFLNFNLIFLAVQASPFAGFSCCRAWALGARASVVMALRFSCSAACGILPYQESNPCPLHWQVDS